MNEINKQWLINFETLYRRLVVYAGTAIHIIYLPLDAMVGLLTPYSLFFRGFSIVVGLAFLPLIPKFKSTDSIFYCALSVYAANLLCNYYFCTKEPSYFVGLVTCAMFLAIAPFSLKDFLLISILTLSSFVSAFFYNSIPVTQIYLLSGMILCTFSIFFVNALYRKKIIDQKNESDLLREQLKIKNLSMQNAQNQLLHDVKTPLMALKILSNKASVDHSQLLKNTTDRVESIIFDLNEVQLNNSRRAHQSLNTTTEKKYNFLSDTHQVIHEFKLNLPKDNSVRFFSNIKLSTYDNLSVDYNYPRVLSNLLTNALESRNKRLHEIQLAVAKTEKDLLITIKDNGCGVRSSLCEKILDLGFSYKKKNGSGLGLSYAKKWAERQLGTLDVFSQEGKNFTVTLKLPIP